MNWCLIVWSDGNLSFLVETSRIASQLKGRILNMTLSACSWLWRWWASIPPHVNSEFVQHTAPLMHIHKNIACSFYDCISYKPSLNIYSLNSYKWIVYSTTTKNVLYSSPYGLYKKVNFFKFTNKLKSMIIGAVKLQDDKIKHQKSAMLFMCYIPILLKLHDSLKKKN